MNLCFTGTGTSGSWQIRGHQLAQALGCDAIPKPRDGQLDNYDTVVIVKKFTNEMRGYKGRKIWDVIDCWPQPLGNSWSKWKLVEHIKRLAEYHKVDYMVAATEQMRKDLGADFTLYHHHRPDIKKNPIRNKVNFIGYEGDPRFLGKWFNITRKWCEHTGVGFVLNPPNLADVDIVIALRDGIYKGYGTDNWKSNVKLANAKGSGTPIICNREAGYMETRNDAVMFADTENEYIDALNELMPYINRIHRSMDLHNSRYSVENAAKDYLCWMRSL